MFEHLVIFKFNATATPDKQQELIYQLLVLKAAFQVSSTSEQALT
jgi:hypothetical protein